MNENKSKLIPMRFLFAAVFLSQMILGAVGVTVPVYAVILEASPFLIAMIGAAGGLVSRLCPWFLEYSLIKMRRKSFISVSMISYGFSCIFYSLAEDPFIPMFTKVLEWISVAAF